MPDTFTPSVADPRATAGTVPPPRGRLIGWALAHHDPDTGRIEFLEEDGSEVPSHATEGSAREQLAAIAAADNNPSAIHRWEPVEIRLPAPKETDRA